MFPSFWREKFSHLLPVHVSCKQVSEVPIIKVESVKIFQEQYFYGNTLPNLVKTGLKWSITIEGHCRKGDRRWPIGYIIQGRHSRPTSELDSPERSHVHTPTILHVHETTGNLEA